MNNLTETLLSLLHDIREPVPPSWWPPAPGWWGLFFLLLLLLAFLLWRSMPWLLSLPTRYFALRQVKFLKNSAISPQELPLTINNILKRVISAISPRHPAITYSGKTWLDFLDKSYKGKGFSRGDGRCLGVPAYTPNPTVKREALLALVGKWIVKSKINMPS